jgi:biotin operon repressor
VLFTADAHEGLASGAITVTFRNWRTPQVKVGGRYAIGASGTTLLVDDMRQVAAADIDDEDARRAGEADRVGVWKRLTRSRRTTTAPEMVVWRIEFHRVEPDPGPPLSDDDQLSDEAVADIDLRLDRLDKAGSSGPWTRRTLRLVAKQPGVVSSRLAEMLGRERPALKVDIRKLKRLGLTESLGTGYRIAPRGRAYLARSPIASRRQGQSLLRNDR